MKLIITHFFEKRNPKLVLLRFGLSYSGVLAMLSIIFQKQTSQLFTSHHKTAELLLVAAITAFLQTLIGYGILTCSMKKGRFE